MNMTHFLSLVKQFTKRNLLKFFFLSFYILLATGTSYGQIDYFDVTGDWAGNDANGNAVIKWEITICAGSTPAKGVTVRVPSTERSEAQSGATSIADEDSPADDDVCNGYWNTPGNSTGCDGGGDWDNFRPADYKTTGILVEDATLCANRCANYNWTTYSKDYDSNTTDYDHYVIANWSDSTHLDNPGFDCIGAIEPDHIDCINTNTNCGGACPECMDRIACDDVATNNYEQILGLGANIWDGPNYVNDCVGDFAYNLTVAYVACHHGQSDYEAGYELTSPGETAVIDITPDAITNIRIKSDMIRVLEAQGADVTFYEITNPNAEQYLVVNPNYDGYGSGDDHLTLSTSTIPSGVEEDLTVCTPSQPECDTVFLYIEWKPSDLQDMFNGISNNAPVTCDNTGNIDPANALNLSSSRGYWERPNVSGYYPLNGYQNPGTVGATEGAPTEEATNSFNPDPEFGNCGAVDSTTCSAGPAEDCAGFPVYFGYTPDVNIDKNVLSANQHAGDINLFDVEYEIIVTNNDAEILRDIQVSDDLVATFGSAAAYETPFLVPPTIDMTVVPNPLTGMGWPTLDPNYDGDGNINFFDGMSGVIQPGDSIRFTFTVTVDRSIAGYNTNLTNTARVDGYDCSQVWCVSDIDADIVLLPCAEPEITDLTDETICFGRSFTSANVTTAVTNGAAVTYQWYDNNGTDNPGTAMIFGEQSNQFNSLPTAVGAYSYRVEVTGVVDPNCPVSRTVDLVINEVPICSISGMDTVEDGDADVVYTGPAGVTTYAWSVISGDAMIDGPSNSQTVTLDFGSTSSVLELTTSNIHGCPTTCTYDIFVSAPRYDYPDYSRINPPCSTAPCHRIRDDLYLGMNVTEELVYSGGGPNADSDLDDGVSILPTMDIIPGNTVVFPITIYNTSGDDATLRVWIDWNGDGDFDEGNEKIADNIYDAATFNNTFLVEIPTNVPVTAPEGEQIGMRIRLSTDPAFMDSPCGNGTCVDDGEVEDYSINIGCPASQCMPVQLSIKSN